MTSFAYTLGTRYTRAASARDAVGRPRASGRLTRSARRHGGNTKREGRACRVRWGDGRRRGAAATSTKREGRACRVRLRNADAAHAQVWQRPMWLRRPEYRATPQSVFAKVQGRNRRPRPFGQYDNPIIFHTLQWVKQRASQPQNRSPCPRASARSVLTGRRPRDVPAPPLHGRNKLRPSRRPPSAIRHREGRNSLRPFIASRASEATPL